MVVDHRTPDDRISSERLAELIEELSGHHPKAYVIPSTLRMGELESILRELHLLRLEWGSLADSPDMTECALLREQVEALLRERQENSND